MNQNQNEIPYAQHPNTFNQVDEQLAAGHPATVLVERTNGDITTAQIAGVTEGETNVFFGDIAEGPKSGMPYKSVGNERLTDGYQEKLAEQLGGVALRNEYAVLLQGSDEQVAKYQAKKEVQAERQRAAEWEAGRLERERMAADQKYNLARQSGASHEEAERSANRAYTNRPR